MALPSAFIQQMQARLGASFPDFSEALTLPAPTSLRLNPYKNTQEELFLYSASIPWLAYGRYLMERPIFTLDPAFHAGAYYVQEASSMSVLAAIRQWIPDTKTPLKILDLCAAPGGKTTLLTELGQQHLIVANEVINTRYSILQENLQRWGTINKVVTNHDVKDFEHLTGFFDLVLVDAPCSGEGLFRKDLNARDEWSPDAVQLCAARQKRILAGAQTLVKPGGLLLYCTCTYNDAENKNNVEWLQNEFGMEGLQASFPSEWKVEECTYSKGFGYQFFPHRLQGEGFFFSGLRQINGSEFKIKKSKKPLPSTMTKVNRKLGETLNDHIANSKEFQLFTNYKDTFCAIDLIHWDAVNVITSPLRKYEVGLSLGTFKNKDFIPVHALALAQNIELNYPSVELDKNTALKFFKRENISVSTNTLGWHLVRYHGLNLGWIKVLPKRVNNYLPKHWRIRMEIE